MGLMYMPSKARTTPARQEETIRASVHATVSAPGRVRSLLQSSGQPTAATDAGCHTFPSGAVGRWYRDTAGCARGMRPTLVFNDTFTSRVC